MFVQKALESATNALENKLEEQKQRYTRQVEELHEKVEQQKKINSQQEKHRHQIDNERVSMN